MAGFLDSSYGVSDARRERRTKTIVVSVLGILVLGAILYFSFRTYRQEHVVKEFLSLLKQQKYQDAYQLWGANKYYPPDRFIEDWGPSGQYKDAGSAKIDTVDVCGSGVVFAIDIPNVKPFGLWVETGTNALGFAPPDWVRCPGRHLQIGDYLKSLFK